MTIVEFNIYFNLRVRGAGDEMYVMMASNFKTSVRLKFSPPIRALIWVVNVVYIVMISLPLATQNKRLIPPLVPTYA